MDHRFAVPAVPPFRHPRQDLHASGYPYPASPHTPRGPGPEEHGPEQGHGAWSTPSYRHAGSSHGEVMYYQGTPVPERVSQVYRRLSQQPRDYAAGVRAGSAVPWTNPLPSSKYTYTPGPQVALRSQSVHPGAHGAHSLPGYRGLSREDRNWLLNTSASARVSDGGSGSPHQPSAAAVHEEDQAQATRASAIREPSRSDAAPAAPPAQERPARVTRAKAHHLPQDAATGSDPPLRAAAALHDWHLKLVTQSPPPAIIHLRPEARGLSQWVTISGFKMEDGNRTPWNTSAIAAIIAEDYVQTSSGTVYRLVGPLDQHRTREQGLSAETTLAFQEGFPEEWVDVLVKDFSQIAAAEPLAPVQASASSSRRKDGVVDAGDDFDDDSQMEDADNSSLGQPQLGGSDERILAPSLSMVTRQGRKGPSLRQQQTQPKAKPSPALKRAGASPKSCPSSTKRVRLAVPRSDSEKSDAATPQRPRRGKSSPRASLPSRRLSFNSPRSPRFDAPRSVPRELSMLTKSPFGVMRAVKSALAATPQVRDGDRADVFSATPTRTPRSRSKRTATAAATATTEQEADSSPTQWATADEGETHATTPGRRSLRARRVSNGGGKWWVVSKSETNADSEDEGPFGPDTCSPSVLRARKMSTRGGQPGVGERPPAPAPSPLQPRKMRSLPAISFASPRHRAAAEQQQPSPKANKKQAVQRGRRSHKPGPTPKKVMIAAPAAGLHSPEPWSSEDEEWEKDL